MVHSLTRHSLSECLQSFRPCVYVSIYVLFLPCWPYAGWWQGHMGIGSEAHLSVTVNKVTTADKFQWPGGTRFRPLFRIDTAGISDSQLISKGFLNHTFSSAAEKERKKTLSAAYDRGNRGEDVTGQICSVAHIRPSLIDLFWHLFVIYDIIRMTGAR